MEREDLEADVRERELHTALESTRVARELAERASQSRRDFMGLVSELRGPLTGIELLIERMRRDRETPPTGFRQEKIIASYGESAATLNLRFDLNVETKGTKS